MEVYVNKRDACSCGDLRIELLTMHFQILQYFFHGIIKPIMAEPNQRTALRRGVCNNGHLQKAITNGISMFPSGTQPGLCHPPCASDNSGNHSQSDYWVVELGRFSCSCFLSSPARWIISCYFHDHRSLFCANNLGVDGCYSNFSLIHICLKAYICLYILM